MSVDILPVSARASRKNGGQVVKANEIKDLRVRLHFENQVITGYRDTGNAYLTLRLPLGPLPIYVRYDQRVVNAMFPNQYVESSYGDGWGASGTSSGGGSEWVEDPGDPGSGSGSGWWDVGDDVPDDFIYEGDDLP